MKMKSKHVHLVALIGLVLVLIAVAGCGTKKEQKPEVKAPEQKQEVITLKMADTFPVTHPMNAVAKSFIKKLEDTGKIKVEYYPAGQLNKANDALNIVMQGMADISYVAPVFLPGQLELSHILSLPNIFNTPQEGNEIFSRLIPVLLPDFQKYGVRPLFYSQTPQYNIFTSKKPINSIGVVKGIKIRGGGGITDKTLAALGSTPVTLPSAEIYEAFQRGVIDGVAINYVSARSYKLDDLAKYATLGANLGSIMVVYVMSEKSWNNLPDDLKKVVAQAAKEASEEQAKVWDDLDEKLRKEFEEKGITIYRLSPEDQKILDEVSKVISEQWVEEMEKKGYPARQAYQELLKAASEIVKK